jgi:tetratricopeptide (TPR) repeat protein
LTEEDKLRLANARAMLSGDLASRIQATRDLARLRAGDMQLWRTAAELALVGKDYPAAIDAFENATKLEPENIVLWNTLGYAHAFAGNLSAARKALEEYRRIAPGDANALDSLGEVRFYLGRFAEAEKYYLEAFNRNRTLLGGGEALRAGMARLMMGDRETADKHFAAYLDVRKQARDILSPVRQGLWLFWTGRRGEAVKALEQITVPTDAVVAAQFLLSLWDVQFGDLEKARNSAAQAVKLAKTGHPASLALVARLLASPPGPITNVEALTSEADPRRRQLLGYSLLLHRNYADAARVWSAVYDKTSAASANEERILLAWAETERGNLAEAANLMRAYSIPPQGADPGLPSILFPRSIFLKAMAEQHVHNREEAHRLFKLFLDYSAGRDFIYGEERRARQALGRQ